MKKICKLLILLLAFSPLYSYWQPTWGNNGGGLVNLDVDKDFHLIKGGAGFAVRGDFAATGNTIMDGDKSSQYFAWSSPVMLKEDLAVANLGTNKFNKNSSSAHLKLPPFVKAKDIVWAGLFWQAQVHGLNGNEFRYVDGWNKVHLKTPDGVVHSVEAAIGEHTSSHSTYNYTYMHNHRDGGSYWNPMYRMHFRHFYSCYVDVTDLVKNGGYTATNNKFTVGNIVSTDGRDSADWQYFNHINEPAGAWYNNLSLGHFGGWSLVIVYSVDQETAIAHPDEIKYRNVSIYNGYDLFSFWTGHAGDRFESTVNIAGFRTPTTGSISSKMLFFGGGGDYGMDHDTFAIEDGANPGSYIDATNSQNSGDQKFNGTYTNLDSNIVPNKSYFQGMDLDIYDTSSMMTHNQESTKIKFGVVQQRSYIDQVFPQVIAFSTELYFPKLCYDYSLRVNKFTTIPSQDRNFKLHGLTNDELMFKVMIRSQESDFDLTHAKQYLTFTPNDNLPFNFDRAEVTYSNTNGYHSVTPIDSQLGIIPIGKHIDSTGGVIGASERMYSKSFYKMPNGGSFEGKFDVNVEANVSFDGVHDVHYVLSTSAPEGSPYHLNRCPTNQTYDPIYGMFNVEDGNATFNKSPEDRFSLPTQVTNVPYKVTVASYDKDGSGKYMVPKNRDTAFEVEIIDAGNFENNSSTGYDATCEDPDSYSRGAWIDLNNTDRASIEIPRDYPQYPNSLALRKAAFRMWVLIHKDDNGHRVPLSVSCKSQDSGKCFSDIYKTYYKNSDDAVDKFCSQSCDSATDGNSACYDCLRQYYAKPVCSRDVFSIRPDGFTFTLKDNNQTNSYKNSIVKIKDSYANTEPTNLVAGYKYVLDVNATTHNIHQNSIGYYFLEDNNTRNTSMLFFNDNSSSCIDKSNKNISVYLRSGATEHFSTDMNKSINTLQSSNVGRYYVHMEDSKWTEVDQVGYQYRPFPNHEDCVVDGADSRNGELVTTRGCKITSNHGNYHDLHLNFHPYDIDTSSLIVTPNSNYIYVNDLNKTKALISTDSTMAVALKGRLIAKDYNGNSLSNYTATCAAKDLNIKLSYKFDKNSTKDSIGRDIVLQNVLADNTNNTNELNVTVKEYGLNSTLLDYNFTKSQFVDRNSTTENGKADFKTYINFRRDYNVGINPFKITIKDLNLTAPSDDAFVEKSKHSIVKKSVYNSTKTVYYAKTKSKSDFYDDISDENVTTPIIVTIFCNDSLEGCEKYGIDTKKDVTDEYDWWIAKNHTAQNGRVMLESKDNAGVSNNRVINVGPSIIENFNNGVDEDVKVEDKGITKRPYITKISPSSTMINSYPWLLFNKTGNNPPKYIYKVRFVPKPSDKWSGGGGTGHTVNTNASGRRTKKIDW